MKPRTKEVKPRTRKVQCRTCASLHIAFEEIHAPITLLYEQNSAGVILFRGTSVLIGGVQYVRATCLKCGVIWKVRGVSEISDLIYAFEDDKNSDSDFASSPTSKTELE